MKPRWLAPPPLTCCAARVLTGQARYWSMVWGSGTPAVRHAALKRNVMVSVGQNPGASSLSFTWEESGAGRLPLEVRAADSCLVQLFTDADSPKGTVTHLGWMVPGLQPCAQGPHAG